jgi:hypothetical protein
MELQEKDVVLDLQFSDSALTMGKKKASENAGRVSRFAVPWSCGALSDT